jgi:hypothetical protein
MYLMMLTGVRCVCLQPTYTCLLDVGTVPRPSAIANLVRHHMEGFKCAAASTVICVSLQVHYMEFNEQVGGVCGEVSRSRGSCGNGLCLLQAVAAA